MQSPLFGSAVLDYCCGSVHVRMCEKRIENPLRLSLNA
jgi:hypothetical protein